MAKQAKKTAAAKTKASEKALQVWRVQQERELMRRGRGMTPVPSKKAKAGKKRPKPSAAVIRALRAGNKRYWAERRGTGKKGEGGHIPLKVLKDKMVRLQTLIAKRAGDPGWK